MEAAPLLKGIEPLLRPDLFTQLKSAVDPQGNLGLKSLKKAGLDVVFDERKLELRVSVPADLRWISSTQLWAARGLSRLNTEAKRLPRSGPWP